MLVILTAAAERDLTDAVDWYDARASSLGLRFLDEFEVLIARLTANPRQFPVIMGEARRAGFRSFPYGLFFRIRDPVVDVFACFHASREPRKWQRRI